MRTFTDELTLLSGQLYVMCVSEGWIVVTAKNFQAWLQAVESSNLTRCTDGLGPGRLVDLLDFDIVLHRLAVKSQHMLLEFTHFSK